MILSLEKENVTGIQIQVMQSFVKPLYEIWVIGKHIVMMKQPVAKKSKQVVNNAFTIKKWHNNLEIAPTLLCLLWAS